MPSDLQMNQMQELSGTKAPVVTQDFTTTPLERPARKDSCGSDSEYQDAQDNLDNLRQECCGENCFAEDDEEHNFLNRGLVKLPEEDPRVEESPDEKALQEMIKETLKGLLSEEAIAPEIETVLKEMLEPEDDGKTRSSGNLGESMNEIVQAEAKEEEAEDTTEESDNSGMTAPQDPRVPDEYDEFLEDMARFKEKVLRFADEAEDYFEGVMDDIQSLFSDDIVNDVKGFYRNVKRHAHDLLSCFRL
uniref:Myelin transcription factor 1-like protein n=1 Tax=Steinernema glaseri TaxID=37863 RepID=A0A1I7ZSN7_9BILA